MEEASKEIDLMETKSDTECETEKTPKIKKLRIKPARATANLLLTHQYEDNHIDFNKFIVSKFICVNIS